MEIVVKETNHYHLHYLDTLNEVQAPSPDESVQEMYLFLSLIVQRGMIRRITGHITTVLHSALWKHYERRHFSHTLDSFTSLTTKMNTTGLTKTMTDCEK
jgi:hypothetical protein